MASLMSITMRACSPVGKGDWLGGLSQLGCMVLARGQGDAALATFVEWDKCRAARGRAKRALRLLALAPPCAPVSMKVLDQLKFNAEGLIPAIIQEQSTGRVLMMAWMNRASLEKTLATGRTWFWSRSRQQFWMKGESSGHVQTVKEVALDCDGDTLLIQVEQVGPACHQGYKSCFYRAIRDGGARLEVTEPVLVDPQTVYGRG